MKNFFKVAGIVGFFACAVVFAFVMLGDMRIPNQVYITTEKDLYFGKAYTCHATGEVDMEKNVSTGTQTSTEYEYEAEVKLLNVIPVKSTKVSVSRRKYVVVGGDVFGIRLYTKGVIIVKTDEVSTANGNVNPAKKAGLKVGDVITHIDGKAISRNNEVSAAVEKSEGKKMVLNIERNGVKMKVSFYPALSGAEKRFRAGIWVRDSSAGIGTITFYDRSNGFFAGLGHAVCDVDTGEVMPLSGGDAVQATVKGCYKGTDGAAGELCGVFSGGSIGKLFINGDTGVYGKLREYDAAADVLPVALKQEVKTGKAKILATIDEDGPRYYDIEITKIYMNSENKQKNMIIKVTDEALISKTGGIVQGMSGTPIIQDDMIVGAVTHVFVNNPQEGYAIFAETMMQTSENVQQSLQKLAS